MNDNSKLALQLKSYIKSNTDHLNLDECDEFVKGYYEAMSQIERIIDEYPLGELLVNKEEK